MVDNALQYRSKSARRECQTDALCHFIAIVTFVPAHLNNK